MSTTEPIFKSARSVESVLAADELDKMWADFGRTVHHNLMHEDLVKVLNRACLTFKTHTELVAAVRAFILTGVKP